jgi:hypothetical protein
VGIALFFELPLWKKLFEVRGGDVHRIEDGHRLAAAAYFLSRCGTFSALYLLRWMNVSFVYDRYFADRARRSCSSVVRCVCGIIMGCIALRQKVLVMNFVAQKHMLNVDVLWNQHRIEGWSFKEIVSAIAFANQVIHIFDIPWIRIETSLRACTQDVDGDGFLQELAQCLKEDVQHRQPMRPCREDFHVLERLAGLDANECVKMYNMRLAADATPVVVPALERQSRRFLAPAGEGVRGDEGAGDGAAKDGRVDEGRDDKV